MNTRHIAIAQLDVKAGEMSENFEKIKHTIHAHRDADIIVFPELILHGHLYSSATREEVLRVIRLTPSTVVKEMYAFARRFACRIIFGELYLQGNKIFNSAVYVNGDQIERYHKIHVHWSEIFTPGNALPVFGSGLDTLGTLICFDSAFPEPARVLALKGARMIAIIAAIPRSFDKRYVVRRLTSIALDNQVFVIFANRAGRDYNGNSMVISPRGDIVASAGEKEEILSTEIDLLDVERWRKEEPIFPHRRPRLYKLISEV